MFSYNLNMRKIFELDHALELPSNVSKKGAKERHVMRHQYHCPKMTPVQQFDVVRTVRNPMRYVRLSDDFANSVATCSRRRVITAIACLRDCHGVFCRFIDIFSGSTFTLDLDEDILPPTKKKPSSEHRKRSIVIDCKGRGRKLIDALTLACYAVHLFVLGGATCSM